MGQFTFVATEKSWSIYKAEEFFLRAARPGTREYVQMNGVIRQISTQTTIFSFQGNEMLELSKKACEQHPLLKSHIQAVYDRNRLWAKISRPNLQISEAA